MKNLFVSYSRDDKAVVQATILELQDLGLSVWTDSTGIRAGKQFSAEIAQAITDCDFFLLFVSSTSIKSDFVRREIDVAHKKERIIIPIRLEEVDIPTELDLQLAGIQWIEYKHPHWMYQLLLAIGATTSDNKTISDKVNVTVEDHPLTTKLSMINESKEDPSTLQSIVSSLTKVLKIFERDFIYPKECDQAIIELRELAITQPFDQQHIHLQYVFEDQISEIINQVVEFRKICKSGTLQSENEKKSILQSINNLMHNI